MINKIVRWYLKSRQKRSLFKFLGEYSDIHYSIAFAHHENIEVGRFVYIGPGGFIEGSGGVRIEDGAIIGPQAVILSSSHDFRNTATLPYSNKDERKSVVIENGVWLGYGVKVCPGVKIGAGAVVGMGSVVTKSVPRGEIVGGNPAVKIGERPNETTMNEMLESEQYYLKAKKGLCSYE